MKNWSFLLILVISGFKLNAQITLSGNVTIKENTPVNQSVLRLEGTTYSTSSNENGYFRFVGLTPGKYTLNCSFSGFEIYRAFITLDHDSSLKIILKPLNILTNEVTVSATRAGTKSGMTFSEISKEEIEKTNIGQDVPYLLQQLPSVVVTSDAGTGIGYSGIRIRGSDPSRINVSINGIPINDAESQQMYWVDLPDFASSADNIQVQRGAGTSTNGTASFGGSINLLSNSLSKEPYAQSSNSFGSFNTLKNNISLGTGLIKDHWAFEGRLSRITSDGYIDRGTSDLKSYYLSGGYYAKSTVIRFNTFSGHEVTYQCWNGVPESRYKNDKKGMQDFINRNYLDDEDAQNLLNSGRTYNYFTYENQVDDYQQDHYQLLISQSLKNNWLANIALHYTKGSGFYEEYKKNQALADYGIEPLDTINFNSDLIRRKWLDNDFYGSTFNIQHEKKNGLRLIFGGGINRYDGDHFGEVIWARYAGNSEIQDRYYDDNAVKNDFTIYQKTEFPIVENVNAMVDLQFRTINYSFTGVSDAGTEMPQDVSMNFFNPKAGITWQPFTNSEIYGSVSIAHNEPNRDDFTQSPSGKSPKAEQLTDYEAGFKYSNSQVRLSANLYYMDYNDQLVLTGKVNDVGNYTRTNIPSSYRRGIEIQADFSLVKTLSVGGNITLSSNKIKNYSEYIDSYDAFFNYAGQIQTDYHKTEISFSPSVIASGKINWIVVKNLEAQFITKYVGKQFLDNTGNDTKSISAYTVCDIQFHYKLDNLIGKQISFDLMFNNLFSKDYASNGYTYGYAYDGTRIDENFYFPQAKFNMLGQITFKF